MTDVQPIGPASMDEPATMAKLTFGQLTEAWKGEASDFTPLLAAQLDALGEAIGVDLASIGESEVPSAGGRRIDIVAPVEGGPELVVENQYGRADHDHLSRGLAYAVAREARGLVVVAEEHRDEFKEVAEYLNALAKHDSERGISVWLVEARAVRIGDSAWAPLFTAVVEPNEFTAAVEKAKQSEVPASLDELLARFASVDTRAAAKAVTAHWRDAGHKLRLESRHMVLEAKGPAASGVRTVAIVYVDGAVMVPFGAYAGQNSGIPIAPVTTSEFRSYADELFGFNGTEKLAKTVPGWLTPDRVESVLGFCRQVADAYATALAERANPAELLGTE